MFPLPLPLPLPLAREAPGWLTVRTAEGASSRVREFKTHLGGASEEGRGGKEGGAENGHWSDCSPQVNGAVHTASSSLDLSSVATPEAMHKVKEGRSGQTQSSKRGKKKGAHLA